MAKLFLVFTTDCHHSHASRDLRGAYGSKTKLFSVLSKVIKEKVKDQYEHAGYESAKDMHTDLMHNLTNLNQTQGLDEEFEIEEIETNTLDYKF